MVRKQVYLTREQSDRLRREATRRRKTEAEVLRDALDQHFGTGAEARPVVDGDPLWDIVGIASPDEELSERVDELLYGDTND